MNNFANIEFINFDSLENNEKNRNMNISNNDIEMEYLNNFLLEKFGSVYESQADKDSPIHSQNTSVLITENQSQISFYSEVNPRMSNASFASLPTNEFSMSSGMSNYVDSRRGSVVTSPNEPIFFTPPEDLEDERVYICDFENCTKKFKFKWILDRHYISHKSAKLYKCTFKGCIKAYKSKENLTLHFKNIHLNEKPYNCRFCPSVFSHRNGKTYHERKFHTNYLPHKCATEDCGMSFASKSALTYHVKSQHIAKSIKMKEKMKRSKFNQDIMKIVNNFETLPDYNNGYSSFEKRI